jgi:hypothetical protein
MVLRRVLNSSNFLIFNLPGDSDSSEVTETLLSEAQEQALKNSVPEGEEEEEAEGEGEDSAYVLRSIFTDILLHCAQ